MTLHPGQHRRMRNRETYHHGQLRDDLIDEAEALIGNVGPQGWSMREAARRLGVSQAAPYRHFTSKDALIDAVVLRGYSQLEYQYVDALNLCDNDQDRLAEVAIAYFHFAIAKPGLFTLMFSSLRLQAAGEATSSYRVFEDEIAAAQSRGELPIASASEQAQLLWAAAHGIADLVNRGVFSKRHGSGVAASLIRCVIKGLS